jgi:hypothetical protein
MAILYLIVVWWILCQFGTFCKIFCFVLVCCMKTNLAVPVVHTSQIELGRESANPWSWDRVLYMIWVRWSKVPTSFEVMHLNFEAKRRFYALSKTLMSSLACSLSVSHFVFCKQTRMLLSGNNSQQICTHSRRYKRSKDGINWWWQFNNYFNTGLKVTQYVPKYI